MTYTLDAEDQITQILDSLPLDVASLLVQELQQYTFDASNQISAAGFSYDARGRRVVDPERAYTWDGADRLTGITWGSTSITYEYTAQGEVAKRTVNGVLTEYFYNYGVRNHPIMAEKKGGNYLRFYIHTPDGRLLYFVDVPNVKAYFYHFNHIGTTLFLTDDLGNVTDTYGYSPYGRLLKQEGTSDQPFTYVGEHGVREEGDTGLYQMRARYYDSLTARFLSRDPIWPDLRDPKAINPYQYARQNPLSFIDPSGLSVWVNGYGEIIQNPQNCDLAGEVNDLTGDIKWFTFGTRISERNVEERGLPKRVSFWKLPGSTEVKLFPEGGQFAQRFDYQRYLRETQSYNQSPCGCCCSSSHTLLSQDRFSSISIRPYLFWPMANLFIAALIWFSARRVIRRRMKRR